MTAQIGFEKLLLVGCLALQATAYVVERGDALLPQNIMSSQKAPGETKDNAQQAPSVEVRNSTCVLPPEVTDRIQSYQPVVDTIIDYITAGEFKGQVYNTLAEMVDIFGPRMTGSPELEAAIDWVLQKAMDENLDSVETETAIVPKWIRNEESAWMLLPRVKRLNILGLGTSVGTPPEGIEASVLVVRSFEELEVVSAQAAGKIVVFNPEWVDYSTTVKYRTQSASQAAKHGAVGALVRSVAPFSIDSPHTGNQQYSNETKIPVASITVEDAAMLQRMQDRGQAIVVELKMDTNMTQDVNSRNTVLEIRGTLQPEETVLVSGHIDSWDVGDGAMDDGGGAMISWATPVVLKRLGLTPRRTVRAVLWTAEEQGLIGSDQYFELHKDDHQNFQLIIESDSGTFTPQGISFTGTPEAQCMLEEVLKLTEKINTTQVTTPADGPDIQVWQQLGVPIGGLLNDNGRYFWFHHSHGDTLTVLDPDILDRCLALWTSVAYVMADLEDRLPHGGP